MKKFVSKFVLSLILTSLFVALFSFTHHFEVRAELFLLEDNESYSVSASSSIQIMVPDDYPTIQEAIVHAAEGATITVKDGTYYEAVTVNKKLTLIGVDYPVIDSNESRSTVMITADGVTLQGFNVTNCGYSSEPFGGGIELSGVRDCVIVGNNAYDNKRNGISLTNSNYNKIENNICANNSDGIRLWSRSPLTSSNNLIKNNICFKNRRYGIEFWSYIYMTTTTNDNIITLNDCSANREGGIYLGKSVNCVLSENTLSYNEIGVFLDGRNMTTKNITVTNNLVLNNSRGLYLYGTGLKETLIVENTIGNNDLGIYCQSVYGNEFYHNDFINNIEQVHLSSSGSENLWDNGVEGNYWSNYDGTDIDEDGIGDVPYIIDENNQDNYPLMAPWNSGSGNVTTGPGTWTVDDSGSADFHTIQEAINAAGNGDTVLVFSGTYYENVIVNKTLTVESESGAENTIVCTPDPETGKSVFEVWAGNVEITGFTIRDSTNRTIPGDPFNPASYVDACGIYVGSATGTKISRNIVRNNFEGIVFANCSNIIVSENQITENIHEGARLVYSSSATLIENSITRNHHPEILAATGLVIFHCTNSEVLTNQIDANDNGVVVSNSHSITVSINSIINNRFHGLNIVNGNGQIIFGNNIRNNTYGICPSGGSNNQISGNTLQENDHGIAFYGSSNNLIYSNAFINNSIQVGNFHGHETNLFDNGFKGNYWSDYNGTDSDGDGIGDVPYVIDENNQDNCPLMYRESSGRSLSYQLIVDSIPSGVTFTIDNVTSTTPWSKVYNGTTSVTLVMPESHSIEGENYIWWRWIDGDTNRIRTVTVDNSTALTAMFKPGDTSLKISILSPENKTYATTGVPLEIAVNRIFYSTSYSLDGQANVTIIGNTTLTGLSEGPHNIIVYIQDTPENVSASHIIHFTIDTTPPRITDVHQLQLEINGTIGGVQVNATVTDAISGVEWVALNYTDGNGTWNLSEMTNLESDTWSGTIPALPHGTNVTYIIIARDKAQNTITTEELSELQHQYEVIPEFSSWIILPLTLIVALFAVDIVKKTLQ
ncbi:MAG: right-handed parallel beta-helix repeat-containing protein [Candidatus Bathyarchaeum sp.]|nr:MAG: right-handed parallel beta-helix repeat-containing protein [Candidatus Bathyarchaeum sp.]